VDWLSFPCSVRTLRSSLEFPEFRELGLDRAPTTAIPISNTGIIPTAGITTDNPTMGITEDRHTIGITGIECITVTTVIIITIAMGATRGTRGTRTNNKTVPVVAVRVNNPDRSSLRING
jgi:hypothetical protein